MGIASLNRPAKFGFFPAGKELSARSSRGCWKADRVAWVAGELPLAPTIDYKTGVKLLRFQRVAVGAAGRQPARRVDTKGQKIKSNRVVLREPNGRAVPMVQPLSRVASIAKLLPAGHHLYLAGALSAAKHRGMDC